MMHTRMRTLAGDRMVQWAGQHGGQERAVISLPTSRLERQIEREKDG